MSNPKSKKNTDISLSSNALFFKFMHHFGDWDFETGYMTRIERSIYFDMKSFYLRTGKPLTDDMSMLERYLRCTTDEEKTALQFLLADKFTHCKKTKRYKHCEWDLMIKNYRHAHRNDVTQDERCVTGDVTPDVTDDVTQNDRIKALRKRNKLMINALKNIGVNVNSRTPSKELQALCEKHNIDVTQFDVTQNSNDVTQHGNDVTDDVTQNELEKSCYNQEPRTINQEPLTNNQVRESVSSPTLGLSDDEILAVANNHIEQNSKSLEFNPLDFLLGNGIDEKLAKDFVSYKKSKLKKGEKITQQMLVLVKNQAEKTGKISFADALKIMIASGKWQGFNADWNWQPLFEAVLLTENRQIPDWLINPAQNTPVAQITTTPKLDPAQAILCNGVLKPLFPNMSQQQSWNFVNSNRQPYETLNETHDRLMNDIDWQNFDYSKVAV